jgi:hypothetical protein
MQFSDVVMVYFIVGAVLVVGGPGHMANGPVGTFLGMGDDGDIGVNSELTEPAGETEDPGLLGNLLGPLREGASNVFGGTVIGAMGSFVIGLLSLIAWPVSVTANVGAPWQVQLIAGTFVAAMTVGAGKVLRASL